MRILWSLLFSILLFSCINQQSPSLLNREALTKQIFRITTTRDTVIKTAGGALLKIDKGSLTGGGAVDLEVKEAYSFEDIIKAGLTTQSNGQALSSGGMIYIDAVDKNISVAKPIGVSMPTENFDVDMKLYKGQAEGDELNWTTPKPLDDSLPKYIQNAKAIFTANCATCHALDKTLTGPALRGVEHRGPWNSRENLFAWTRNPGGFIPLTKYTICLAHNFNGQIMPSFPQLSDTVLDAVYDYIKYNEIKSGYTYYRNACDDSCRRYDSALLVAAKQALERQRLVNDNGPMTQVFYQPVDTAAPDTTLGMTMADLPERDLVSMEDNHAEYYKFSISAFGWYNVDRLMKGDEDFKESTLTISLESNRKSHVDIYLAIPSMKVFTKAGRTNNENEFAFDTKDGKLPLPQGVKAYIFAMSEDEEGVSFAFKEFTTSLSQNIGVDLNPSTKEEIYTLIHSLALSDVSLKVEETKNVAEVRKVDKEIKIAANAAEKLRPKNCDCDCEQAPPAPGAEESLK